jgi:hypothetical protein
VEYIKITTESKDRASDLFVQFSAIDLDFGVDFEAGSFAFTLDPDDFGHAIGEGVLELFAVSEDDDGGGE